MTSEIDKQELLRRLQSGYEHFRLQIAPLTATQLERGSAIGSWSVKDLVAHFIAHEQFALHEISAARRGQQEPIPFPDTDETNSAAIERYADATADQVLQAWETSFHQIVALVQSLDDNEFAPEGPLVRCLGDSIDGALANNTYEHYAEHAPALLLWVKRLQKEHQWNESR